MKRNEMTAFKLTLKYIVISFIAVFGSFFFHELFHWIAGELLGYKMTMTLNSVFLAQGNYRQPWHEYFISAAGPAFTLLQAIAVFIIIQRYKNIYLYPFLFFPLYMRLLAALLSFINPNDEARISKSLGLGSFTLFILICAVLFFLVTRISKQEHYTKKFQWINVLLAMVFSSVIILADQFLHIHLIN